MTSRVESTDFSTVVYCTDCAEWSEGATNREAGYALATGHDSRVHPGARRATDARYKQLQRKKVA